ncbi:MAG: anthranilate synthase component I family protein [Spirochaetaceae bacterium]|jgi:anthranilate synthase component 1|nr:anthranilate synthase component I family protein [Spirochaetaceae bacterium]
MCQIDRDTFKSLAADYRMIPVWTAIPLETRDPLETFQALKNLSRQCFILESLEHGSRRGRYTFLGYDPKLEISCINGLLTIKNGAELELRTSDPGQYIKQIIQDNKSPRLPGLPPFTGGLAGYFAYDYLKYREPSLSLDAPDQEGFKDVDLMLFDKVIAYDHLKKHIILMINAKTDAPWENYNRAAAELGNLRRIIETGAPARPEPLRLLSPFRPLFDKERFCDMAQEAKRHIREGDIFQAVLSNRLDADAEGSLFDTYRALRALNPSPYMFYFSSDHIELAGASPETLARLEGRTVWTFPLAGTRPRGRDEAEDAELERELLADPKELAEHNMLVDLGRNDLGKVSEFSSVVVEKYLSIERFSHVMHLGSAVSGRLREEKSALDVIDAVLPAGTLSGAPKIRACQIINRLENNKRGIYGGAVGYAAFTGDMDTCISIRLAYKKNGKVFVRSGAGIVADSEPEKEYCECASKMQAVMAALEKQGGPGNDSSY